MSSKQQYKEYAKWLKSEVRVSKATIEKLEKQVSQLKMLNACLAKEKKPIKNDSISINNWKFVIGFVVGLLVFLLIILIF